LGVALFADVMQRPPRRLPQIIGHGLDPGGPNSNGSPEGCRAPFAPAPINDDSGHANVIVYQTDFALLKRVH